jgi:hypothetical protein
MDNELADDDSLDRREFLERSSVAAAAAASWWALTEKTDALAQTQARTVEVGGDPINQNYAYASG